MLGPPRPRHHAQKSHTAAEIVHRIREDFYPAFEQMARRFAALPAETEDDE